MVAQRIVNPSIQVQVLVLEFNKEDKMGIKLTLRKNEKIDSAVRRFQKLVDKAGIMREVRNRQYYEKPSAIRRRDRLRAERRGKARQQERGRRDQ